jgi:hypothetical protein
MIQLGMSLVEAHLNHGEVIASQHNYSDLAKYNAFEQKTLLKLVELRIRFRDCDRAFNYMIKNDVHIYEEKVYANAGRCMGIRLYICLRGFHGRHNNLI